MRRVVVTGLGVVSAIGMGADKHFQSLKEARCGISTIELIPTRRLTVRIAAEAKEFDGAERFSRHQIALYDRVTQMALTCAEEARKSSGIEITESIATRAATVIGTSMGGQHTQDDNYRRFYADGVDRVHPFTVPRLMANAAASHISIQHGLQGPAWSVSTACASSNHAIGQAFHLIRSGLADIAFTGGCESGLTSGVLKAWEGLRVMARDTCRPFSRNRSGMVQGEGAAILILEELERAKARGANILCEIAGFGMTADASDIVQPSRNGASRAMRSAIEDARIDPADISYVNAHGTGTQANDKTECAAIRECFGAHADQLMISSTKSMHGHAIGAAGALEMAAVIMAVSENVVAPTINYEEPDPECDLDVVPNQAREKTVEVALSNSFAFGGLNAVLVAKKLS